MIQRVAKSLQLSPQGLSLNIDCHRPRFISLSDGRRNNQQQK
jgi:hypothetical protein